MSMDEDVCCESVASGKLYVRAEADGNDEDGEADLCLSPCWQRGTN